MAEPRRFLPSLTATAILLVIPACGSDDGGTGPGDTMPDPEPVYVVYTAAGTGGNDDVYIMEADGSGKQQLTFTPDEDERFPALSPDRSRIAYNAGASITQSTIWTMNRDGTGLTVEADSTNSWPRPRWMDDGNRLVTFNQQGTLGGTEGAIVLYTLGTSAPVQVSDILGQIPAAAYGDARVVAVASTTMDQAKISLYDLDDAMPAETELPLDMARVVRRLNWAPNGATVVFETGSTSDGNIATRGTAPGGATVVLTDGTEDDAEPVYSPDGQSIYFIRDGAFYRMDADGTDPVEIVPAAQFGGAHMDVR